MAAIISQAQANASFTRGWEDQPEATPDTTFGMRVLILVHGYPPTYTGGAEQRAARTAQALQRRGCAVRVLCVEALVSAQQPVHWRDSIQDGIQVRRLFFHWSNHDTAFRESYDNPHTDAALVWLLQEWQPDIVYLFSGYLMTASVVRRVKAHHIPIVIALTDYWWLCHRINLLRSDGARCNGPEPVACARCQAETFRRYRLPARATPRGANLFWTKVESSTALAARMGANEQVERRTLLVDTIKQADALISPSHYLARMYVEYGADPARVHVWRQGVDVDQCLLRPPAHELRVGYLGQIKPHKGAHTLIEAWQRLTGTQPRRLTFYGSDIGENAYGKLIRDQIKLCNNVSWNGHYVGEQVWEILSQLDVVVIPSRWVENSPNSILEAQAVGVPVVGTNLGGIAELVQDNVNGLLFAPDDSADLARQLQRLLDDPALLQRLRYAEMPFLNNEAQIDSIVDLFTQLISKNNVGD